MYYFFFFQAEDGIRDYKVTGVQTCALPIFPDEKVGRGNLVNVLEDRVRARNVSEREVVAQGFRAQAALDARILEQAFHLGREDQAFSVGVIVERLFSGPVPSQDQAPPRLVPDHEG